MGRQTCDWKAKVDNCDRLSKPRLVKPNFQTDEPVCPEGQLQCGNGECLEVEYFCDKTPHCKDGSDETACSVNEDPNRAGVCDPGQCLLPDCFCSADGTQAPGIESGKLEVSNLPMMISITFNGAINTDNVPVFDTLFHDERLNPNGCTAKGTFFVSHKYTNYSAVQEFFAYDASIAVPLSSVPVWPYTLHYRRPHKCPGNNQSCPSKSHPVWELPINELDRREDPDFDEFLTGCHLVSSCSSIYHKDQFRHLLQHNFDRHYGSNRAPLSLSFDPAWLISNKGFTDVLDDWMSHILNTYSDVYFVTGL